MDREYFRAHNICAQLDLSCADGLASSSAESTEHPQAQIGFHAAQIAESNYFGAQLV